MTENELAILLTRDKIIKTINYALEVLALMLNLLPLPMVYL
jgi:hypothetical protein